MKLAQMFVAFLGGSAMIFLFQLTENEINGYVVGGAAFGSAYAFTALLARLQDWRSARQGGIGPEGD